MKEAIVAVELTHSAIKVVIGYELDEQPYVLYASNTPLRGAIKDGRVVNAPLLSGGLKQSLNEASQRAEVNITEIVLALPPKGLQIYEANRSSTVVSTTSKVEQIDVKNVINIIRRDARSEGVSIVGIVPDVYILEDGKKFLSPPIGYASSTLTIQAKIHRLPSSLCDEYAQCVEAAGYKLMKAFVSTYATSELFKNYPKMPKSYILADFGAKTTTLSLIGNHILFGGVTSGIGGDDLIDYVAETLNINLKLAEQLIIKYGYDVRDLTYVSPIGETINKLDQKEDIYVSTLGEVIGKWLKTYVDKLQISLRQLINEQGGNEALYKYPLVITGGFSHLNGLKQYLDKNINQTQIIFLTPRSFGARHGIYAVALGLIKAITRYKSEIGDEHTRVTSVERTQKERKEQAEERL